MDMTGRPDTELVRRCLDAVLASETFSRSERLRSFLAYVVDQELKGKGQQIKGYSIGVDVFSRPPDFDAANDPLVRVQAGKLRKLLDRYYQDEGRSAPLHIRIPLGSYVPEYIRRPEQSEAEIRRIVPAPAARDGGLAQPAVKRAFRSRTSWRPRPVSSHMALLTLLPLFFLTPTGYSDPPAIDIANAQFALWSHTDKSMAQQALPELRTRQCPAEIRDCRSLMTAIEKAAEYYRTVRLDPGRKSKTSSLSYSMGIESSKGRPGIYVRVVHDMTDRTIYAEYFRPEQLRDKTGLFYEALSFSSRTFSTNGHIYSHAMRAGIASGLMKCLARADSDADLPGEHITATTCLQKPEILEQFDEPEIANLHGSSGVW